MSDGLSDKTKKMWLIAAICGVVSFLALLLLAGYSAGASIIVGILVTVLVAILLWIGWYSDDVVETPSSAAPVTPVVETAAEPVAEAAVPVAPAVPEAAPAAQDAVVAEAPSAETVPAAEPKAAPAPKKAPAKKAAPKKAAAKPAAATEAKAEKSKPAAKAKAAPKKAAPKKAPVAKDGKPELLTAARAGGADDLKQIKGVGPKIEKGLNELGLYHFDQIAGLRKKEVEWVDNNMGFKGRIERDGWVAQAKLLAKGEETEFSKRVKKGGVY